MAQLDAVTERKARVALAVVSRLTRVVRAYLFGSQLEGAADRWSDVDLAVFIEGLEAWNLHDRARVFAQVQKEAGDDVEVHFLPAQALQEHDPAGFAAWVLAHGAEVAV
jgi:predicted nucleotidyltransferase